MCELARVVSVIDTPSNSRSDSPFRSSFPSGGGNSGRADRGVDRLDVGGLADVAVLVGAGGVLVDSVFGGSTLVLAEAVVVVSDFAEAANTAAATRLR